MRNFSTTRRHTIVRRAGFAVESFSEKVRLRPLGVVVLVASAALLVVFQYVSGYHVQAPAVADAVAWQHPSPLSTVIHETHVQPGDVVEEGTPLVTLSSLFLERDLALVDAEIERLSSATRLDLARLTADDLERQQALGVALAEVRRDRQRAQALAGRHKALASGAQQHYNDVAERVRKGVTPIDDLHEAEWTLDSQRTGIDEAYALARAEKTLIADLRRIRESNGVHSTVEEPLQEARAAELQLLEVRRRALLEDYVRLTVSARTSGRVVSVLEPGSAVNRDTSAASVLPEQATQIVAYITPETSPDAIEAGALVNVAAPCRGTGQVLRVGATVEQAPGQLSTLLRAPLFGRPLYVSVPRGCSLGVGQVLAVELSGTASR